LPDEKLRWRTRIIDQSAADLNARVVRLELFEEAQADLRLPLAQVDVVVNAEKP
jgi:hypothetical protein